MQNLWSVPKKTSIKEKLVTSLREAIKKREYIRTLDLKEGGGQFENLIFT